MSEFSVFTKYLLAQAEHGSLQFLKLEKKLSTEELYDLFRRVPFILDNKYKLWCAPVEEPVFCMVTGDFHEYKCQVVLPSGRVQCYDSLTGRLISLVDSKTLFDGMKRAYSLCMLRVSYMNSKLGTQTVPTQDKPQGEPKDKLDQIIDRLNAYLGIPKDQAIVTPPPAPPPLKEDMPELQSCYNLAKRSEVTGFIEALNAHDFKKALSFMVDVGIELANRRVLELYSGEMNSCVSALRQKG